MKESKSLHQPKLSPGRMVGYGLGEFAGQFVYTTISIYIMYFFTDVALITAVQAGIIMLVAQIWDAVFDPIMGYITDHTRTRWGQKRPYMLFGAVPLGIAFFLLLSPPALSPDARFIYLFVLSIVVWTLYSVVNVPYNAMLPNLTLDSKERSDIVGIKSIFLILAVIILGAATLPIARSMRDLASGFSMVGLIYGTVCAVFVLICFASTREYVQRLQTEIYTFRDIVRLVLKNRPFVILCITSFLAALSQTMISSMMNYFFKYNLKEEGFIPIAFSCIFGVSLVGVPVAVMISKKFGKKITFIIGMLIYGGVFLGTFFLHEVSAFAYAIFIIAGFGFAGVNLSMWAMIPDTVEYGEHRFGMRAEGVLYGVFLFVIKAASGFAQFFVGQGLHFFGYVSNAPQTPAALDGIRLLISIVPLGFFIIGILVLVWYPITERMHRDMRDEIEKRSKDR